MAQKKPPILQWAASFAITLLAGFFTGIFLLAFFSGALLYDYKDTIRPDRVQSGNLPVVDVIVCLAGGRGRIGAAADLWYRYWQLAQEEPSRYTPILYISGVGSGSDWDAFAQQVRKEVLEVLPKNKVILEKRSTNTFENAALFIDYAKLENWKTMILLTSTYHMKRSAHLFRYVLDQEDLKYMRIETMSVAQEPFTAARWRSSLYGIQVTMFEFIKWAVAKTVW